MTVAELLADAARTLREAGVSSPEWDSDRLLRHVQGWDRAALVAARDTEVAPSACERFRELLRRRASRVPLQHLLGWQEFWRHTFSVSRDALIPRPETELLVEQSLALLADSARPLIVDVGTGTGCIALSLAAELPGAVVHATDLSEAALAVARGNAERLGLDPRVALHHGDLLTPVASLRGRVDLVVSNPPYVDASERASLEPEVREHEPELALFPPGDALAVYRRLVPAAFAWLRPGGFLLVEIAPTLRQGVRALFDGAGFTETRVEKDLAGRPRMVGGRRPHLALPGLG